MENNRNHFVHFYKTQEYIIQKIVNFASVGLNTGSPLLLVVSEEHKNLLVPRLSHLHGEITVLDAEELLPKFMVNGFPHPVLFSHYVESVVNQILLKYGRATIFSEMVNLLWSAGNKEAALKLEEYWRVICDRKNINLFCAYFLDYFDEGAISEDIQEISELHLKTFNEVGEVRV